MEMIKLIAVPFRDARQGWHHGKGWGVMGIEQNAPQRA
jgi:hypothetical protein